MQTIMKGLLLTCLLFSMNVFAKIELVEKQTIGYGAEKPVGRNSTDSGRGLNRRVEFVIIK